MDTYTNYFKSLVLDVLLGNYISSDDLYWVIDGVMYYTNTDIDDNTSWTTSADLYDGISKVDELGFIEKSYKELQIFDPFVKVPKIYDNIVQALLVTTEISVHGGSVESGALMYIKEALYRGQNNLSPVLVFSDSSSDVIIDLPGIQKVSDTKAISSVVVDTDKLSNVDLSSCHWSLKSDQGYVTKLLKINSDYNVMESSSKRVVLTVKISID